MLTRAYRTLREPAARASYWLELHGHQLAENNQQVPPALAGLVFEVHDELADLRELKDDSQQTAVALRDRVKAREAEVAELRAAAEDALERVFAELDETLGDPPAALVRRLKTALAGRAYLETLRRDLRKALDSEARP